jgi:predicted amidohydrolase
MKHFYIVAVLWIFQLSVMNTLSQQQPFQLVHFGTNSIVKQSTHSVTIASCSIFPKKWDKEFNWKQIHAQVTTAAEEGADLVVTPEGVLDGYVINEVNREKLPEKKKILVEQFIELSEPINGTYLNKIKGLADELNIFLVIGFLEKRESDLYNTVVLIDPDGEIIARYSKTHFAQGYTINPKCYLPGDSYPVFHTPFGIIGMLICYDRQLPEPARILAVKGAQILLVPSYGSYGDDMSWNTTLLRTRAYENRCALVFSHPHQSLMISRRGDIISKCGTNDIAYFTVNTNPQKIQNRFSTRRPSTYSELINTDAQ